tara:strand:+ start:501 stop:1973 length:1473 start_codon:yes stop_codon:yes gene_type:complete
MASNTYTVVSSSDNLTQVTTKINTISKDVGATGKLTTIIDSDIVGAINELDSDIGARPHTTLTTNTKTLTAAINELHTSGGASLTNLIADSAGKLGGFNDSAERNTTGNALNSLSTDLRILDSDVGSSRAKTTLTTTAKTILGAINELDAELGDSAFSTSKFSGGSGTLVQAVNFLDSDLGNKDSLNTTSKLSLVSAINELNTAVASTIRFTKFLTDSAAGGDSAGSRIVADSAADFIRFVGGSNLEVIKDSDASREIKINHTSVGAASVDNSGTTFIQDITIDANGHVTGVGSAAVTSANDAQHIMAAGSGIDVSTSPSNFSANASTNVTTTYSIEADLVGEVHSIGLDADHKMVISSTAVDWHLDGTNDMRLENDGDLHVDGDVIAFSSTTSDMRLKDNIEPISDALSKVNALTGYTFTYEKDGRQSAGLLAQEVEEVLPSAVANRKLPLQKSDDNEYKTLEYNQTIALLVESIKELKQKVDELERGS